MCVFVRERERERERERKIEREREREREIEPVKFEVVTSRNLSTSVSPLLLRT